MLGLTGATGTSVPVATMRGGVSNIGNSCYISVVLQELAQFPQIYDQVFAHCPSLEATVQQLCSGETINPSRTLADVHWRDSTADRLHRLACAVFPFIFTPALGSPFQFYDHVRSTLGLGDTRIRLIDEDATTVCGANYLVDSKLKQLDRLEDQSLVRIRIPVDKSPNYSVCVRTVEQSFTLMQVHYTPRSEHICTVCRISNEWVHFDDANVKTACLPPQEQTVLLLYLSSTRRQANTEA